MTEYKLSKDKATGEIVVITEARRGRTCDCVCPDCGKDFVAAQGDKNEWHFRHYDQTNCKGGQETALHLIGKKILVDNSKIAIPGHDTISYSDAVAEKGFMTKRPDVTATFENEQIFFEILVSHPVDSDKEIMFVDGQHKSIEIDLQKYTFVTREDLEKEILTNCENKRIIFWEKNVVATKNNDYNWFLLLVFGVFAFFGLKSLLQRRR
jgi:hypothetical protein